MLSIATGHDCGYLTGPVAVPQAGRLPGLWYGDGAEALGLTGEVDADLMEAMYSRLLDPRDPRASAPDPYHKPGGSPAAVAAV